MFHVLTVVLKTSLGSVASSTFYRSLLVIFASVGNVVVIIKVNIFHKHCGAIRFRSVANSRCILEYASATFSAGINVYSVTMAGCWPNEAH